MAVYYVYSGAAGSNNGLSWANGYTTLTTALSGKVAGDILFVAHDHAESSGVAVTLSSSGTIANPIRIICADRAGLVPPVSADRRTTAQVATTANTIGFTGFTHYDGIIFIAGSTTATANIALQNSSSTWTRFDNCSLRLGGSGASNRIQIGGTGCQIELNNTTVSFAAAGQGISIAGILKWRNTASAVLGTIPTVLFPSPPAGDMELIGVDLSALGSGKTIFGTVAGTISQRQRLIDCKLDAAVTKAAVPGAPGANEIDFVRSGAIGVNYTVFRQRASGALNEETTVVRSGGASDGTTPIAWKIDTTANCSYSLPFECPPIAIWNDVTGSPITATIEGIWGGGAVPNDDDIWIDIEYLGSSSSPQGSFVNDGKVDLLATAAGQTSSSVTWGGSTTKFKLNVTFTAQQKGWIYARVKCAKASTTFYIDPLVTLT